ncbi:hypothetical protein ACHAWF_007937 [Thalassiosira exigua]
MAPAGSWAYLAAGTLQTCNAQGFINIASRVASMSYYAALMVLCECKGYAIQLMSQSCQYVFHFNLPFCYAKDFLTVRFGWTESYMSKRRVRLSFVLPPIIIALGFSIPPLLLQMYNVAFHFTCTIVSYPYGCETGFAPDTKCIRG